MRTLDAPMIKVTFLRPGDHCCIACWRIDFLSSPKGAADSDFGDDIRGGDDFVENSESMNCVTDAWAGP